MLLNLDFSNGEKCKFQNLSLLRMIYLFIYLLDANEYQFTEISCADITLLKFT